MFFSRYFSFPLSVSFHICSILIHLPPTLYNVFLPVLQFSPVSIIPPLLHTHSFIYHQRCIIFFSQYFCFPLSVSFHHCSILIHSSTTHAVQCFSPSTSVFPCQYHFTFAPYSFIHLPPTLYNVFLPILQFSPVSIIPPLLHTHSFIYHPRCTMFFSQYFCFPLSVSFHHCSILIHSSTTHAVQCFSPSTSVFPCQYHSTFAPYSFIHLPFTLIMIFSRYFSFPLSVSFHLCSILIHSFTTHAV